MLTLFSNEENKTNSIFRSTHGAPLLFLEENNGHLRGFVDYRAVNWRTGRNNNHLPRRDEMFDRICDAKFFST